MKKVLIGILIGIVIIAVIIGVVFYLTADVTRAGDQFFALVRDGNAKGAYQSAAREFQASTSEEQFMAFLKNSLIVNCESAAWTSRSVSNNVGELEGSLKTKDGGVIPIKVKLVKEDGKWKLLSIEKAAAGVVADTQQATVPADAELITMANGSVLMLGRAIKTADFGGFYSSISEIWKKQTTADTLKRTFQSFSDQKIDLTVIDGKNPEFSEEASIDESGRLILNGFYLVPPVKIKFTLKYIQEERQWKLVGINVGQEEAPSFAKDVMPAESEITRLAHGGICLLARAIARDDFSELYDSISKRWQAQMSREELRNSFSTFIEKKIPLIAVEGKKPQFTASPRFDDHGVLVTEGRYDADAFQAIFHLEFWNEDAQWKLQAINLETKGK